MNMKDPITLRKKNSGNLSSLRVGSYIKRPLYQGIICLKTGDGG